MTMQLKQDSSYNVAVIVARFQVHDLTEAHQDLIDTVFDAHARVIIFLGVSQVRGDTHNPLPPESRAQMIQEVYPPAQYPNLTIDRIKDEPTDEGWSESLDAAIREHLGPADKALLYGSRDSFLSHYKGSFKTRELESTHVISGTEIRKQLAAAPQAHPLFRAGVIYASHQRYPTAYPTVDVAAVKIKEKQVLLVRKPNEYLWRFPGGFVSPTDDSCEAAAIRELHEETGQETGLSSIHYIGSRRMDDWRYRPSKDKIMTHLFIACTRGPLKAADDVAEAAWFNYDPRNPDTLYQRIVETHRPLYLMLVEYLNREGVFDDAPVPVLES